MNSLLIMNIRTQGAPVEVVGPAEIHHLSNMAPFRRATAETRVTLKSTDRRDMAINATEIGEALGRPPTVLADTANPQQPQSSSLGPFGSLDYPAMIPSGTLDPQASGLQTPMSEYTRTAEAMSQYLTWDAVEWWNFTTHNDI